MRPQRGRPWWGDVLIGLFILMLVGLVGSLGLLVLSIPFSIAHRLGLSFMMSIVFFVWCMVGVGGVLAFSYYIGRVIGDKYDI